jgi:hypothetical protein
MIVADPDTAAMIRARFCCEAHQSELADAVA